MSAGLASVRKVDGGVECDQAVQRFEEAWRLGRPDVGLHWVEATGGGGDPDSVSVLAALVKVDLRRRYDKGERPAAAEYLEKFPGLRGRGERVLSLVYEEFCLLEEHDGCPNPEEFCARYAPWKDSLESQLRYHRVLSKVVGSAPPPTRFPGAGERFGPFMICDELGRGGAGRVYRARDESLGDREVALKVSQDRGNEPSILGRLDHAHIVPVLSLVRHEHAGTVLRGLCMPYRPGLPLDEVVRRVDPASRPTRASALQDALGPAEPPRSGDGEPAAGPGGSGWEGFPKRGTYAEGVAWVVAVLAEALAFAHARQIFHRDVKPANVLLTSRGGPQLLDFNLSHDPHTAVEAEAALRGGTLPYMAPEQLDAFINPSRWGAVAEAADIYSLGLLLRELLTGRPPETPDQSLPLPRALCALLDRRAEYRVDLRALNPHVPYALEAVAARCLAYSPADRYPDAASIAADLRRFLARRPLITAVNPSAGERAANWLVRNRLGLAAALLGSAFLASTMVATGGGRAKRQGLKDATPRPEARPEFTRTLARIDLDAPDVTLTALKRLGPEAARSPVVATYLGFAHSKAGHRDEAAAALGRVWEAPDAEASLARWYQGHRDLADKAEGLAVSVLNDAIRSDPGKHATDLELAAKTLRLVVRFQPTRYWAWQGLGVFEEARRNFPAAHAALTAALRTIGTDAWGLGRFRKMTLYSMLGRVSTSWGQSLLAPANGAPDPLAAETRLLEALADLDNSAALNEVDAEGEPFENAYVRCEALWTLADAVRLRGNGLRAASTEEQAELVLERLGLVAGGDPTKDRAYQGLRRKVRERKAVNSAATAASQDATGG